MKTNNILYANHKDRLLTIVFYVLITVFAFICLLPFLLMITSSLMSEKEILTEGYKIFPKEISFSAYEFLFNNSKNLVSAYKITITITAIGTVLGLFIMSMAGYVLCRKDFKYRNQISFFFILRPCSAAD